MKFWMADLHLRNWTQVFSESGSFLSSNGKGVYFFDLTDNKVISDTLSEPSQDFCTFRAYFEVCTLCRYVSLDLTIFSHWSNYREIVYFLNFGESVLEFHVSLKCGICLTQLSVHITVNIRSNSTPNYTCCI